LLWWLVNPIHVWRGLKLCRHQVLELLLLTCILDISCDPTPSDFRLKCHYLLISLLLFKHLLHQIIDLLILLKKIHEKWCTTFFTSYPLSARELISLRDGIWKRAGKWAWYEKWHVMICLSYPTEEITDLYQNV
jgi:hypothetical protein